MSDRRAELRAVVEAFWSADPAQRPTMREYKAAIDELEVLTGEYAERLRRRHARG